MRQRQAHPVNPYVSKAGLWPSSEQRQLGLLFTVFACDDTTRLHEVLQIEDRFPIFRYVLRCFAYVVLES